MSLFFKKWNKRTACENCSLIIFLLVFFSENCLETHLWLETGRYETKEQHLNNGANLKSIRRNINTRSLLNESVLHAFCLCISSSFLHKWTQQLFTLKILFNFQQITKHIVGIDYYLVALIVMLSLETVQMSPKCETAHSDYLLNKCIHKYIHQFSNEYKKTPHFRDTAIIIIINYLFSF